MCLPPPYRCHSRHVAVPVETAAVNAAVPQIGILEKPHCNAEEEDCS